MTQRNVPMIPRQLLRHNLCAQPSPRVTESRDGLLATSGRRLADAVFHDSRTAAGFLDADFDSPVGSTSPLSAGRRSLTVASAVLFWLAWSCLGGSPAQAENHKLLEIEYQGKTHVGRISPVDEQYGWLIGRDGRKDLIDLTAVDKFKELPRSFRPYSTSELRDRLRKEFGPPYDAITTRHYVICGPRDSLRDYQPLMEEVYQQVTRFFEHQGWRVREPEFPLIAIVFGDRARFNKYCSEDNVEARPGMAGYYLPTSNRIALWDQSDPVYGRSDGDAVRNTVDTVIHEATHQIAFNCGLHPRLGDLPKWFVEGLATVAEAEGLRQPTATTTTIEKINRERFLWFRGVTHRGRPKHALKNFISSDEAFKTATLDAYAESWALTYSSSDGPSTSAI
jgi:hypothetical protein